MGMIFEDMWPVSCLQTDKQKNKQTNKQTNETNTILAKIEDFASNESALKSDTCEIEFLGRFQPKLEQLLKFKIRIL